MSRGASLTARVATALLVIAVIEAESRPARGSPLELFGAGGRSPGLGGAGGTDSAGYDSAYLNPAGLSAAPGKRLSFGYLLGDFALEMDGEPTDTERPSGVSFGAVLPLPMGGALKDRVGLGLGFYIPTGSLVRVKVPAPGDPVFSLLETRSTTIGILVASGVRLSDRWRLGAGVLALAALRGHLFVDADGAGRFTTDSEQSLVTQFAPIAGATFEARRDLRLGATLRGVSRADYDIRVTNDLASELPIDLPTIRIAGVAQYDPLTFDAEAAYQVSAGLRLYGQLRYQRWSAFPLPTENPLERTPPQESPGFHDTVRPHLAAELTRPALGGTLAVRTGYAFIWSPAPEMRGRQSLLDNHRHLLAAGLGLDWAGRLAAPLHLDLWTQLHWLVPRRHEKDPDAFGPSMPLPFETIHTRGRILVGGLTLGIDL
jgi:long-subunit fatty acid transport protein